MLTYQTLDAHSDIAAFVKDVDTQLPKHTTIELKLYNAQHDLTLKFTECSLSIDGNGVLDKEALKGFFTQPFVSIELTEAPKTGRFYPGYPYAIDLYNSGTYNNNKVGKHAKEPWMKECLKLLNLKKKRLSSKYKYKPTSTSNILDAAQIFYENQGSLYLDLQHYSPGRNLRFRSNRTPSLYLRMSSSEKEKKDHTFFQFNSPDIAYMTTLTQKLMHVQPQNLPWEVFSKITSNADPKSKKDVNTTFDSLQDKLKQSIAQAKVKT